MPPAQSQGKPAGLATDAQLAAFQSIDWTKTHYKNLEQWCHLSNSDEGPETLTEKQAAGWLKNLTSEKAGAK